MNLNQNDLRTAGIITFITFWLVIVIGHLAMPYLRICGDFGCDTYDYSANITAFAGVSFIFGWFYFFSRNKLDRESGFEVGKWLLVLIMISWAVTVVFQVSNLLATMEIWRRIDFEGYHKTIKGWYSCF